MSMPGFVFYFRCDACNKNSDDYSIFPFHDLFRPDISLPAWSRAHKCWSRIQMSLSEEQRKDLEADSERMTAFATTLSTESFTVCVPQLTSNDGNWIVSVAPEPTCPYCGVPCRTVFGYPPPEKRLSATEIPLEERNAIPISAIDLSVRSRNICSELGIRTLGQLCEKRDTIIGHKCATESSMAEIDRWIAVGQEGKAGGSQGAACRDRFADLGPF